MKIFLKIILTPVVFSLAWLCLIILAGNTPDNPTNPQDTDGLAIIKILAIGILCVGIAAIALATIGNLLILTVGSSRKKLTKLVISLIANLPLLLTSVFSSLIAYVYSEDTALSTLTTISFLTSATASILTIWLTVSNKWN